MKEAIQPWKASFCFKRLIRIRSISGNIILSVSKRYLTASEYRLRASNSFKTARKTSTEASKRWVRASKDQIIAKRHKSPRKERSD